MSASMPLAVVLVSGGLDSATVLSMAQAEGFACVGLSFDYGQRHRWELSCAARVCAAAEVREHRVIVLDPSPLQGSALTGGGEVPRPDDLASIGQKIPDTYVPARNTIFLSMALGLAEGCGSSDLFIGANAVDYSGYPDSRPEFIAAFDTLANLATRAGVEGDGIRIHAPLLELTKAEIIREGTRLGVDYGLTSSCYNPASDGSPCRACESCALRAAGFASAGLSDPLCDGAVQC
ncbi:MAG: 7-cyano-7-deazaguanine synthase QueC [Phycisphaerales bacterium]|nr:7-cyano-7-deazaguanine synthase QueC [Phycisphaerales bacterium]MDP6890370.1 7-cyano-7-deazaguanine synthase QueC [Phycisphaerales bacterium]